MAGTLTISTLSDGTNSTSSTNCIRGSAKAWVQSGSGGTIASSFNVSSVTYNGTGDYSVNYLTAFANINYSIVVSPIAAVRAMVITTNTLGTTNSRVQINYVNFPGGNIPAFDSGFSAAVFA